MTRPIYEPTPARKDAYLDFQDQQLFRQPAPTSANVLQLFHFSSDTDLSNTYTTLDWADDVYTTNDGVSVVVNASSNIEIVVAGAYRIDLYSEDWVTGSNVGAQVDYDIRVIAGSNGFWGQRNTDPEGYGGTIISIEEQTGSSQAAGQGIPDFSSPAFWQASATFPAEIQFQAQFGIDGVPTATSDPTFLLAITRMGDAYE